MSEVENEVCELIQARAEDASIVDKYDGATMEREDLTHDEWLEHLQHELMDAVIYIQRLRTREQTLENGLRKLIAEWRASSRLEYLSVFKLESLLDGVSE